jgi:carboxypeptidase Q
VIVGGGGPRDARQPPVIPQIVLEMEHYGRIARALARKVPVSIEMDVRNRFHDQDPSSFNVLAELPGRDKRAEVVMLGAHLDSWHAGTGATDNAAGVAIVVEAARILKTLALPLRRTVRVALWTGEEQGLYGSRAYVKAHFADRKLMKPLPEHGRLSAYFNLDNGTGAIRGVFAQSNDAAIPILESWCAPLKSLGVSTVSPRNTRGTDHIAFDEVGLPGFQFIQDPVDYSSRTHHTNVDTYERLQAGDLMKNAAVVASFAYHAANRAERLPRKPMPRPPAPAAKPAPAAPRAPAAPAPQAQVSDRAPPGSR